MSGCVHVLEEFLNSFFDILVPRPKISGDFSWLIGYFAKRDLKAVGRDNHRKHPFQGSDSDPPTVNELSSGRSTLTNRRSRRFTNCQPDCGCPASREGRVGEMRVGEVRASARCEWARRWTARSGWAKSGPVGECGLARRRGAGARCPMKRFV